MRETPKTNTAAYNGYADLLSLARLMERDLKTMRDALESVTNATTLDVAKWEANNALAATTEINGI